MTANNYIEKQLEIYIKKNRDYGNSFYKSLEKYGAVAFYVRAEDKINRLNKLITVKTQAVLDESVQDTVDDLFNYTSMYLAFCSKEGEHITPEEVKDSMKYLMFDVGFINLLIRTSLIEKGSFAHSFINEYFVFD